MKKLGKLLIFASSFVHMRISSPLPPLAFLLAIILAVEAALKGPPRAAVKELKQIAYFGKDIKLQCPIDGNPSPMIEWKKDGEVIDYSWIRMKASKKQLRIKTVTDEDTGLYICKGINGFGSEQIRIELIAIDSRVFPLGDRTWEQSPPLLTPATRNLPSHYHLSPGSSWRVSCSASGSPQPEIFWFLNGAHHKMLEYKRGHAAVVKDQVTSLDSGTYTCKAKNVLGEVSKNFTLSVSSLYLENPRVTNTGPSNMSIYEGSTASMQCKVKSHHMAHIKWLKLLHKGETADEGNTIKVGDSRFLMIDDTEQIKVETDEYLNSITILAVEKADEGTYICFVTSSRGGFNYQPTHLKVLKAPYKSSSTPSSQKDQLQLVILLISCCISVLLLMILITVCIVRRRNGKSSPAKTTLVTHLPIMEHTKQGLDDTGNPLQQDTPKGGRCQYPKISSPTRYGNQDCNSRSLPMPPSSQHTQDQISRSSPPNTSGSVYPYQSSPPNTSPVMYPGRSSSPNATFNVYPGRSSPLNTSPVMYPGRSSSPNAASNVYPGRSSSPNAASNIYPGRSSSPNAAFNVYPGRSSPPNTSSNLYPDLVVNTKSSPTYHSQEGRPVRYTVQDRGSPTGASENQYDVPFSHVRSLASRNQAYFSPPTKKSKRSFGIKIKNRQPESFNSYKQYYL